MAETKVTKRQFDAAYKKHLPSGWIRFAFKHFSKETEKEYMSLRNHLTFFLLGLLVLGWFGTAFDAAPAFIGTVTWIYMIVLSTLVLYLLSAVLLNNRRLKRVQKILGISKSQYNAYVRKFYP
jgi:hypothetical protein